jgi:hypothetical protein
LINNAFYAVDEKKKIQGNGYAPTVSVITKRSNGKVEDKCKRQWQWYSTKSIG